jgi:uncharacterized protein (UPF0335 family)
VRVDVNRICVEVQTIAMDLEKVYADAASVVRVDVNRICVEVQTIAMDLEKVYADAASVVHAYLTKVKVTAIRGVPLCTTVTLVPVPPIT